MESQAGDNLININLLDNGVDFILKGVDELFNDDLVLQDIVDPSQLLPSGYKYGTLHLFSGFLLLLKERLYRHVPELIFHGNMKDVKAKLASNKIPITVDLDEALERLEIGPRFTFPSGDLAVIRRVQDYRNKFEHYSVSTNKHELWANITKFLVIVDAFLLDQLDIDLGMSTSETRLVDKIRRIETVHDRFMEQQKRDWWSERKVALAKFKQSREPLLADIARSYFAPLIACPSCDSETLVVAGDYKGICTNEECYTLSPITSCACCDQPAVGFPWESSLCDPCTHFIAEEVEGILEHEEDF